MKEYPALIISKNLVSLYKSFNERGIVVNKVKDVDGLRKFILKFSNVLTDRLIVLSDLASLGTYKARILKFIEEQRSPVVCMSSQDSIPRVLMSRFMTIVKYPDIVKNEADSPGYLKSFIEGENPEMESGFNFISDHNMLRYCPSGSESMYYLKRSNIASKRKVASLIFGEAA